LIVLLREVEAVGKKEGKRRRKETPLQYVVFALVVVASDTAGGCRRCCLLFLAAAAAPRLRSAVVDRPCLSLLSPIFENYGVVVVLPGCHCVRAKQRKNRVRIVVLFRVEWNTSTTSTNVTESALDKIVL